MNIYEQYGRLQEAYALECKKHVTTVAVLRALKTGELSLDMVIVNDDNTWSFDKLAGMPVTVSVVDQVGAADGEKAN